MQVNNKTKKQVVTVWMAACAALAGIAMPLQARAHSEESLALSLLPVASVVGVASVGAATASTVIALPAALSVAGAVLTVKAVEVSANGTVYVLERASDGARASVKVLGRAANGVALSTGTAVTVSVIGSGVVLSVAGDVLAYVPNALGRALLHNERLL